MRHVEKALEACKYKMVGEHNTLGEFITIFRSTEDDNITEIKGQPPTVTFKFQSDPIGEVGVNGCQVTDVLEYVKCLFESLNEAFPCRENALTITKIEEALHWQEARTKNRIKRNVEGQNKL